MRTDHGYEAGDAVSQHYDNLVAKVVAWGPDRESARRRLLRALSETEVDGIPTTIPAHLVILSHPDFVSVRHSTTWLSTNVDLGGVAPVRPAAPQRGAERKDVEVEVDGRRFEVSVLGPAPIPGRPRRPGAGPPFCGRLPASPIWPGRTGRAQDRRDRQQEGRSRSRCKAPW